MDDSWAVEVSNPKLLLKLLLKCFLHYLLDCISCVLACEFMIWFWLQWVLGESCAGHQRLHLCLFGANGSGAQKGAPSYCLLLLDLLSVGCVSAMISLAHESNKRTFDLGSMTSLKYVTVKYIGWLLLLVTHWASSSPQNYFIPLHRARGEGKLVVLIHVTGWLISCTVWISNHFMYNLGNSFRFAYDLYLLENLM